MAGGMLAGGSLQDAYDAGWKDFSEKNAATIKANPGLLEKLRQLGGS